MSVIKNVLTSRQKKYLLRIIKLYIAIGEPIGSKKLITKFKLNVSPATVRHQMNLLEKKKYLEKYHISSGRIPSTKGYMFYAQHVKNSHMPSNLERQIRTIFAKRIISIDEIVEEAAKVISNITEFTLVVDSKAKNELCKSIQFIPLNNVKAIIVIVTSTGRVESKTIIVKKPRQFEDIKIAVRILKDRLIDTLLKDLAKKALTLVDLIIQEVKDIEFVLQNIIKKIFNFDNQKNKHIYGRNHLIKKPEFKDHQKLMQIMQLLEKTSIWEILEKQVDNKDDSLKIFINNYQTLISKKITLDSSTKEISIIGSNRLDYKKALPILQLLGDLSKKKSRK